MNNGNDLIQFIQTNNLNNTEVKSILIKYRAYRRRMQNGNKQKPDNKTKKEKNEIIICDSYAIVKTYNVNTKNFEDVLIDKEDIEKIKTRRWVIRKKYPQTTVNNKLIVMHRFILNYDGNDDVDHINKNKFDNRKSNLRIVARVENLANNNATCVYKYGKKYHTIFNRYGRTYDLGYYDTFEEAKAAKDNKLKEIELNKEKLLKDFLENRKSNIIGLRLTEQNKWVVNIRINGKGTHIGTFETKEQAIQAKNDKIKELETNKKAPF